MWPTRGGIRGTLPPTLPVNTELLKNYFLIFRYIKGMEGDEEEARRRWIATLEVRAEHGS